MTDSTTQVCAIRFTDDIGPMQRLLQHLGMRPVIEADRGGWVDLAGTAGRTALHTAASSDIGALPGQTTLSLEMTDLDAVAERLRSAGFDDATVIDESYGRSLRVSDPEGAEVWINEQDQEFYGYRRPEPAATDPVDLTVVPVRFTDDAESYHRFLTALGLVGEPAPGGYAMYAAGEGAAGGGVGVHYIYGTDLPTLGGGAVVQMTFLTTRDLAEIQKPVEAAGYQVTRIDEDFGSLLDIIDPDGQSIQVHRLADD